MQHDTYIDLIGLHIHLGLKGGFDVSQLIEFRKVRYLWWCNGIYAD